MDPQGVEPPIRGGSTIADIERIGKVIKICEDITRLTAHISQISRSQVDVAAVQQTSNQVLEVLTLPSTALPPLSSLLHRYHRILVRVDRKLRSSSASVNLTTDFREPTACILDELKKYTLNASRTSPQPTNIMGFFNHSRRVKMSNVSIQLHQSNLDASPIQEQLHQVLRMQRLQTSVLFSSSGHR
ncbi:hypothetical protein CPB83DRAFT_863726 [Crepidotus variabilis]|uniref:Uncharacterized protein n=1 Tax=Crepidotus variabilis TaxID=179855 RepID=A0A9P6E5Q0_9AGAR|nr:hypothetical protein CPB83DRAFT_863726 [Crepidotus variabilis]